MRQPDETRPLATDSQAARRSRSPAAAARLIGSVEPPGPSPRAWRLSMTINATVIKAVTTTTSNPAFSPKTSQASKNKVGTSDDRPLLRVPVSIPDLVELRLVIDHVETAKHVQQDSQPTVASLIHS